MIPCESQITDAFLVLIFCPTDKAVRFDLVERPGDELFPQRGDLPVVRNFESRDIRHGDTRIEERIAFGNQRSLEMGFLVASFRQRVAERTDDLPCRVEQDEALVAGILAGYDLRDVNPFRIRIGRV